MSDWKSTLPHSWLLKGLPDHPKTVETIYTFYIGHLHYIIPEGKQEIYLRIPEIPARDAEGQPQYPEQTSWINQVLATQQIRARDIGWSHWQFASKDDAFAFEKLLWKFGAMRLWTLQQRSKEPGVLIEYFFFKITPSEAGTFLLSVTSEPQQPALDNRVVALVRRVLAKQRIPAHKKRNQNCWEFDTINTVRQFEESLQETMRRYRTRTLAYAGQL